ncbi:MAG: hypothetical protein IJ572_05270, partial [Bacilli bacterium]|nr:hypothetical protein [Bacilli bacterium]
SYKGDAYKNEGTFANCTNLTTIYVGENWDLSNVTNGEYIFYNASNLVGGAGTVYSSDHVDSSYGHIDGGTSSPGYLTDIADKPTP